MSANASAAKPAATLDQRRAKHAWEAVQKAKAERGSHEGQEFEQFKTQAKKLPTRIMASGLGQSLAFLLAKGRTPGLVAELNDWLMHGIPTPDGQPAELIQRIMQGDAVFLRRATDETLSYLRWLVRFAEAEKSTDETQE